MRKQNDALTVFLLFGVVTGAVAWIITGNPFAGLAYIVCILWMLVG